MTTLATDDFERADENPLSKSGNWSAPSGIAPCKVVSGKAVASDAGGNDNVSYYSGVTWPNDQWSEIITDDTFCCPVVRVAAGASSYYLAAYDSAIPGVVIYKRVTGSYTLLHTYGITVAAGDAMRLQIAGNVITFFLNGTPIGGTINDSALATGNAGLLTETTHKIRAWSGGNTTSETTLSPGGIPSSAVIGSHTLTGGPHAISPSAVASAAAFGAATLVGNTRTILPAGIPSATLFGTTQVSHAVPSQGIPSAVVLGIPSITKANAQVIAPAGIASAATFGATLVADNGTTYPSMLVGLSPAATDGDIVDAAAITNLGNSVAVHVDGTYEITGAIDGEYFDVNFFDDSTGTWHVMSPFRVYVNGTVRLASVIGIADATATTTIQGQGMTVTKRVKRVAIPGVIAEQDPPAYSLVPARTVLLTVDGGRNEREARPFKIYTRI